jgi:spore germination protein GerM
MQDSKTVWLSIIFLAAALVIGAWAYLALPRLSANTSPQNGSNEPTKTVQVYFDNSGLNQDKSSCRESHPVNRIITGSDRFEEAALNQLFAGPTVFEASSGYTSPFSDATRDLLSSIKITNHTAYVNLRDFRETLANLSTSCSSSQLLSEMDATLKNFSSITRTIYAINGNPRDFYEFLQVGCGPSNDNCDDTPFK